VTFAVAACGQSGGTVFLFFSNRMGCLPSLLLSVGITVLLLFLTGIL
jgi:hypothetical protein